MDAWISDPSTSTPEQWGYGQEADLTALAHTASGQPCPTSPFPQAKITVSPHRRVHAVHAESTGDGLGLSIRKGSACMKEMLADMDPMCAYVFLFRTQVAENGI